MQSRNELGLLVAGTQHS